jgi:hypothetical protein
MPKELRIPHSKLKNPQTMTSEMEAEFDACGLDLHRHEVVELEDDFKKGERILRVKNTKYFVR